MLGQILGSVCPGEYSHISLRADSLHDVTSTGQVRHPGHCTTSEAIWVSRGCIRVRRRPTGQREAAHATAGARQLSPARSPVCDPTGLPPASRKMCGPLDLGTQKGSNIVGRFWEHLPVSSWRLGEPIGVAQPPCMVAAYLVRCTVCAPETLMAGRTAVHPGRVGLTTPGHCGIRRVGRSGGPRDGPLAALGVAGDDWEVLR